MSAFEWQRRLRRRKDVRLIGRLEEEVSEERHKRIAAEDALRDSFGERLCESMLNQVALRAEGVEAENARLRAQVGRLQHAIHVHNRDHLRVTLQLDDMGQLPPLDIPPIAEERNGLLFGDLDPLEDDDAR